MKVQIELTSPLDLIFFFFKNMYFSILFLDILRVYIASKLRLKPCTDLSLLLIQCSFDANFLLLCTHFSFLNLGKNCLIVIKLVKKKKMSIECASSNGHWMCKKEINMFKVFISEWSWQGQHQFLCFGCLHVSYSPFHNSLPFSSVHVHIHCMELWNRLFQFSDVRPEEL